MASKDKEKPVYTQPNTQIDLERRLADDHEPDSAVNAAAVVVNPNPFGSEDYAGTDPIYQNYANDTEKPLRSARGAEKKAEDLVREAYKAPEGADVVDDAGMGGKAVRSRVETPVQSMNTADYEKAQSDAGKNEGDQQGGDPTPPSPPSPPAPENK